MPESESPILLRFEGFELDLRTRELRRDGRLVKLQDLPIKLLALLAGRPGELIAREEIEKALWGEDQFVDFEHGINTAMRKIRDALGENADQPRFIETLPRKGYRFIARVEAVGPSGEARPTPPAAVQAPANTSAAATGNAEVISKNGKNGNGAPGAGQNGQAVEEFFLPRDQARGLFLLIQASYLVIYCSALYKLESLEEVLEVVYQAPVVFVIPVVVVTAMCGIAVRLYLLTSVGLNHPAAGMKYRKLFPWLFVLDTLWAVSPFLLVRKIGIGVALASVAGLAYLPFVQRTLIRSSHREPSPSNSAG